ncbi:MAG: virulence protein SciE type [Candidatus Competibacteraceae bacterium]|nr:MAG: virulence protein SciE type [Candidatus Competibacteraceae bacterium]
MGAEQNLNEGKLDETLAQLQQEVRQNPADAKLRIFLFQLYCVLGEWQKALNQLNVLREMDAETLPMVQTYQEAVQCEALRGQVFAGGRTPLLFGEPEPWLALLLEALKLTARQEHERAGELRARSLEQAPTTGGRCNDRPFAWLMDADPRLGPVLEAVINGRYYWIPFQHMRRIELEPPADLRDLVWLPAHFTWANGGQTVGLIPVRYPGSEQSADHAIRMARKTDWRTIDEATQLGLGQRLLATDADDYPLLELRALEFDVMDSAAIPSDTTEAEQGHG